MTDSLSTSMAEQAPNHMELPSPDAEASLPASGAETAAGVGGSSPPADPAASGYPAEPANTAPVREPSATSDLAVLSDSASSPVPLGDGAATPWATDGRDPTSFLGDLAGQLAGLAELGGPVVSVLTLLSVIALAIVLLKLWQFFRVGLGRTRAVEKALALWKGSETEAAASMLEGRHQPVARLVHLAMVGLLREGVDQAMLREELVRVASGQLEALRSYLRALDVIATLSPLLGLLGTVLGMIQAFQQLEAAGSQVNPAILSGGIWQALLTTALGLTVAIPVVLAHTWLERRVERCGHAMEDAVTRVFTRTLARETPSAGEPGGEPSHAD